MIESRHSRGEAVCIGVFLGAIGVTGYVLNDMRNAENVAVESTKTEATPFCGPKVDTEEQQFLENQKKYFGEALMSQILVKGEPLVTWSVSDEDRRAGEVQVRSQCWQEIAKKNAPHFPWQTTTGIISITVACMAAAIGTNPSQRRRLEVASQSSQ
jgi:hypothetical protein